MNNNINAQNYNKLLTDLIHVADAISAQLLHLKDVYTWDETELADMRQSIEGYTAFIKVNLDFMIAKGVSDTTFYSNICQSLLELLFMCVLKLWACLHKLNAECEFDTEDTSKNVHLLQSLQFVLASCQKEMGLNSHNIDAHLQKLNTFDTELEVFKLRKQVEQAKAYQLNAEMIFNNLYTNVRVLTDSIQNERSMKNDASPMNDMLKHMTDMILSGMQDVLCHVVSGDMIAALDEMKKVKDSQSPNR